MVGIRFTETMRGFFSTDVKDDRYEDAERLGQQNNTPFAFTLTITTPDIDAFTADSAHQATMTGTATAPSISSDPMQVSEGVFNLFVVDPARVDTRLMLYKMKLTTTAGRVLYFSGFKTVARDTVQQAWPDLSTLYITVRDGADESGPILGQGILHILPADFQKQMRSLETPGAANLADRARATAKFSQFFSSVVWRTYGGPFAGPTTFNKNAPPRERRPLQVDPPEVHTVTAADGVELRLTRFRGGSKGPVILAHGLGVSSLIFSIDTIDTNLVEFLFARGYDVWLLDFRASIELPASRAGSTGDDVATKDYPAAVDEVRRLTGAPSVQMIAHCWGSTTFVMALLNGLQGVRSAVCSQIATHIRTPTATRLKTGLHLPSFLKAIGIDSLTAYADDHEGLLERVYDAALNLYTPDVQNRCSSATCHRITFMYAPLYQHPQLNQATHDSLHEMFGIANMESFVHLERLTNTGTLVNAKGEDVYMPHLDRLALPICFVHGAKNECFLPESTELTVEALRRVNGDRYERHVIDGYGHIDCIYGKNAARDIYPVMADFLDRTA
jgi:cholesterol oxidase